VFATEAERSAEAIRRRRGRNIAVVAVLLSVALLLFGLTLVRLPG
jgi:hypothetical protein